MLPLRLLGNGTEGVSKVYISTWNVSESFADSSNYTMPGVDHDKLDHKEFSFETVKTTYCDHKNHN